MAHVSAIGGVIAGTRSGRARHDQAAIGNHAALVHVDATRAVERVRAWTAAHLDRGYRIVDKQARPAAARSEPGRDPAQVDHVQAADVYRVTGGRPAALLDWHHALLDHARDAGYTGVAVTCDGPALRIITPDPVAMLTHERDLTALSGRGRFSVLCRYDIDRERPAQLTALIRAHSPVVEDVMFSAVRHDGRLDLAGELDASNADRLGAVLEVALGEGVRVVDLAQVTFLSAATLRVLAEAGTALAGGDMLTLSRPTPMIRRVIELVGLTRSGAIAVVDRHGPD